MTDKIFCKEQLWENGWEGHEKAQLKRMAMMSFQEKIAWLEKAQQMLLNISKQEIRKDSLEKN